LRAFVYHFSAHSKSIGRIFVLSFEVPSFNFQNMTANILLIQNARYNGMQEHLYI